MQPTNGKRSHLKASCRLSYNSDEPLLQWCLGHLEKTHQFSKSCQSLIFSSWLNEQQTTELTKATEFTDLEQLWSRSCSCAVLNFWSINSLSTHTGYTLLIRNFLQPKMEKRKKNTCSCFFLFIDSSMSILNQPLWKLYNFFASSQ